MKFVNLTLDGIKEQHFVPAASIFVSVDYFKLLGIEFSSNKTNLDVEHFAFVQEQQTGLFLGLVYERSVSIYETTLLLPEKINIEDVIAELVTIFNLPVTSIWFVKPNYILTPTVGNENELPAAF